MRATVLLSAVLTLAGALAPGGSAAAEAVPKYTAAQFFDTTSFRVADAGGLAFSPDGRSVLISSDATGVFNAYALPVAGGAPVPLTTSTTDAVFAASYLPDGRVLVTTREPHDDLWLRLRLQFQSLFIGEDQL